jgi:Mrp family chromosome partitioning ATPase
MQGLCHSIETALATVEGGVTIMFSSAHLKEGKTTVAGGLATTLASNFGRSVLIIDGDRQGVLHGRFAADDRSRLADVAQAPETFLKTAKRFGPRGSIAVVRTASLFEGGDGTEMDLLIAAKPALNKVFDYILIDAPALAQVPWSPAIGKLTDGIVLVVEAERTRFPVVRHAKEEFENSGVKVLGVFLNKRKFYVPRAIYRFL